MGRKFHLWQGTNHSKGWLFFGKSINFDEINLIHVAERFLVTTLKYGEGTILLGNIYGPCTDAEKSIFLNQLKNTLNPRTENETNGNILIFGDLNIMKNNKLDIFLAIHTI